MRLVIETQAYKGFYLYSINAGVILKPTKQNIFVT